MENEHLNDEREHECPEGQKVDPNDLKFMRSVLEKSYKKVKPETHDAIMWGLTCMTAYISIHFLSKHWAWEMDCTIIFISNGFRDMWFINYNVYMAQATEEKRFCANVAFSAWWNNASYYAANCFVG